MFILKTSISPKAFFLYNPVAWLTATGGELKELANKKVPGFLKQSLTTVTGEGLSGLGVLELLTSTKRNSWGYFVTLVGLGLGGSGFVLQPNLDTNKKEESPLELPVQETLFVTPEVAPGFTETLIIEDTGKILNNGKKSVLERHEAGIRLITEFQKDRKKGEIITQFIHALLKEDSKNDKVKKNNNEIRRFALDTLIKFLDANITRYNKDRIIESLGKALESDKITDKAFKLELEKTLKALLKSPLTNRVFPYKSHEED